MIGNQIRYNIKSILVKYQQLFQHVRPKAWLWNFIAGEQAKVFKKYTISEWNENNMVTTEKRGFHCNSNLQHQTKWWKRLLLHVIIRIFTYRKSFCWHTCSSRSIHILLLLLDSLMHCSYQFKFKFRRIMFYPRANNLLRRTLRPR